MPGPIVAWARSTGAIAPSRIFSSAAGSSRFKAARKPRRVIWPAVSRRGRSTRTIEEARALAPTAIIRPPRSERTGQVAVMAQLSRTIPSRIVAHPVLVTPSASSSDCLKA